MAMFDKKKADEAEATPPPLPEKPPAPAAPAASPTKNSGGKAVIGATIKIKGDLSGDEDLLIEGRVEGTVKLDKHDLTVGESANVKANVTAKVVRVEGEVIGDVRGIERIVIAQVGRVQGNLSAPRVVVEDGAKFRGSIEMDGFESKPAKPKETPAG